jgi:RND family efflux transporter MFP subunit
MSVFPSRKAEADPQPTAPRGRRMSLAALLLSAAALAGGCGQGKGPEKAPKAVEVIVTTPVQSYVADYQDFTGRLSAIKTVDIRARVSGYITDAPFTEGDRVKEGDVLFRIDPRSYQADFNLAKANLKLAEAQRNVSEKLANRSQRLVSGKNVAQEEYEQLSATLEKDKASVEAMKANVERAELYYQWTTVRAPFAGRISRRLADPGNLVLADNTILTTLVTENPLWAYFDVDERTFLDLTGHKSPTPELSTSLEKAKLPVLMRLANEEEFTHVGVVDFIDNQVMPTTGTIRFRGVFQNRRLALKPGLFARVRLPIGTAYQATLIPDEALQSDQGRKYVYVVKKGKNKQGEVVDLVEYRRVMPGQSVPAKRLRRGADGKEEAVDYLLRVIQPPEKGKEGKEGLAPGERVIVVGQQRVRQGTQVKATVQPPPRPPEVPLVKLLAERRAAPEVGGQAAPEPGAPAIAGDEARARPAAHQGNGGGASRPRHAGR